MVYFRLFHNRGRNSPALRIICVYFEIAVPADIQCCNQAVRATVKILKKTTTVTGLKCILQFDPNIIFSRSHRIFPSTKFMGKTQHQRKVHSRDRLPAALRAFRFECGFSNSCCFHKINVELWYY